MNKNAVFSMILVAQLFGTAHLCWGKTSVSTPTLSSETPESHATAAPPTKGEIKAMREFQMLDFNGDGQLSRSEVKLFPRLSAAFDGADTNHNGFVSYPEVQAFALKYRAQKALQQASDSTESK